MPQILMLIHAEWIIEFVPRDAYLIYALISRDWHRAWLLKRYPMISAAHHFLTALSMLKYAKDSYSERLLVLPESLLRAIYRYCLEDTGISAHVACHEAYRRWAFRCQQAFLNMDGGALMDLHLELRCLGRIGMREFMVHADERGFKWDVYTDTEEMFYDLVRLVEPSPIDCERWFIYDLLMLSDGSAVLRYTR